jgi:hypothetical protein
MLQNKYHPYLLITTLLVLLSMVIAPVQAVQIPVTGTWNIGSSFPVTTTSKLVNFIEQVKNGASHQITGLYVENILSDPVVQQPGGQAAYVSSSDNQVTQFQQATKYGSLGFVAHNNLAGVKFPEILQGDVVTVVYGDGHFAQYLVTQIRKLQALQPSNPYSSFVDLSDNQQLSVSDVFYQTYGVSDQLVLQTCIASQGIDSWGRLFVIAIPYTQTTFEIPFRGFLAINV